MDQSRPDGKPSMMTDPEGYMRDFEQRMATLRQRAEEMKGRLEDLNVRHESEEREVAVTVNLGGALIDIEFSSEARRMSLQSLREMIIETYNAAATEASQKSVSAMSEFLGDDSEAMNIIRENINRHSPGGETS